MRALRFPCLSVLASVVIFVSSALGQNAAPAVRIVNPIDEKQLVTLGGTVHPLANAKNDRGAAPDSTPLERIHLRLKRSASQQAALDQLVNQLHTPGHPNYHKWLTPEQFGKQFAPSDQDIATVETWLTGHGFSVAGALPGKQVVEFSGNVGQFRSAFHAQIHKYQVNGESHFANASDPQIPAAIAPVVGGFVSLNNFHFKKQSKLLGKAQYDRTTDTATPMPGWTWGTGTTPGSIDFVLAPQDFAIEYDLNPLYTASTPVTGRGQTIAILNDSNININLANQFRSLFGLPANPPQVIIDGNDPGVNGDAIEAYLDVEWAGAVAPNATIDLVIGADTELQSGLALAAEHAVFGNLAPVMSLSFDGCELQEGSSNGFWDDLWEEAAAQGTTVVVSAGDNGSAGCDDQNAQLYAVMGQSVNGLASTPFNIAVGATDFNYTFSKSGVTLSDFAPYWSTTTPQQAPAVSLKGYLAEQAWNDSQFGNDVFQTYAESGNTATSIVGGGGGASNAAICSLGYSSSNACQGTLSGYPKPSWQVGTGVPADQVRDLPDVSLFGSNGANNSSYALCWEDGDCQPATGSNVIQISQIGGTSASSPSFAGMMALVNQKYGPQGQANYVLYPMAMQFPAAFHDVTLGTNTVPCALNAPGKAPINCITAPGGLGYMITDPSFGLATEGEIGTGSAAEYNAGPGYDLATGLGTIDANQMVTNWANVKFDATTITLSVTPSNFPHGTAPTLSGTVIGTGTPAGDVTLLTNSTEAAEQSETFFTLSNGSYSNNTVTFLPGGTYNVWTQYGGDGTNGMSTSTPVQITVTPENSAVELSIFNGNSGAPIGSGASFPYGTTPLILDALPLPASGANCSSNCPNFQPATGAVVFSDGGTAINTTVLNVEGDAEYTPQGTFNAGAHSITASYSGDSSYTASSASAITFTVTKAAPSVAVTGPTGSTGYAAGQTSTLSIAVETLSHGASPTGTVIIAGAPAGTPTSAALVPGVDPGTGNTVGLATVTIPETAAPGPYTITAMYTPDSKSSQNYASASGTYSLQIGAAAAGISTTTLATASSSSTSPDAPVTVTGTVTASSGAPPTGSVSFLVPATNNSGMFEDVPFGSPVALVAGSGSSSTFSMTFDSNSLPQGTNQVTVQYQGSDEPSTAVVTISNSLADFSLIANTTIIPMAASSSASITINLTSVNTFAGAVNLTCAVPTGWTCTIPSSEMLASAGSAASTLIVTAPSNASLGSNNILITGQDSTGEYVHTLGLVAQVVSAAVNGPPSFALSNSGNITVTAGATTGNTSTVSVTPSNGFTGTVNLTCSVASPASASSAVSCTVPASVDVTGATTVTATLTATSTSSTRAGAYVITVTGTSAAITQTTMVNITVNAPAQASYALTNSGNISVSPGATTGNTSTITVTPSNGFMGIVDLACSVMAPTGASSAVTCTVPASVDVTGTTAVTATLTVVSTSSTTAGAYVITVTGSSAGIAQTATVNVTVNAAQASYALTNGSNISVSPGATTGNTSTITVTPSNGFTGTVALACAFTSNASTNPATCSLSPASVDITSGALTSTLTINTTAATSAKNEVKKLFWPSTGGVAVASLLFFLTPRRRRNWLAMLGLLAVFAGLAGMGCGGGSGNGGGGGGGGNTGTVAGAYAVTVTGTSGSASQMTTVTLTVN
jgi:trimeric autotransporter adhesin